MPKSVPGRQTPPGGPQDHQDEQKSLHDFASRREAIAAEIKKIQAEEKDQALEPLREEILKRLQSLHDLQDEKALASGAKELRDKLEEILKQKEILKKTRFCDKLFDVQLLLTHYWSRNEIDAEGAPDDVILLDGSTVPPNKRIDSCNGFIYHQDSLQKFFDEPTSYARIKKVGFSVLTAPPTTETLAANPNSFFVLVQAARGERPSALWFVDRSRNANRPEIREVPIPEGRSASSFARALFPGVRNYCYANKETLSSQEVGRVLGHIGAEQLMKYKSPEGNWFCARDIAHFRAKGLNIQELNQNLHANLERAEVMRAIGLDQIPGYRFFNVNGWRSNSRLIGFSKGVVLGFILGIVAGFIAACYLLQPLFAVITTPPWAVLATGIIGGSVHARRGGRFSAGFFAALAASFILLGAAAYFAPIILPALGVVSASTLAASALWGQIILPCLPLAVAAIAGLVDIFKPDSMKKFYTSIVKIVYGIPTALSAIIGAAVGGLVGYLVRDLPAVIGRRCLGRPQPDPNPRERRLSGNAEMHQALADNSPSPRTQAAIAAVLDADRRNANPLVRIFTFDPARLTSAFSNPSAVEVREVPSP